MIASPRLPPPAIAVLLMIAGVLAVIVCSYGLTTVAIDKHARQACTELRILASAPGAVTRYDVVIRGEYQHLYALRCGR